MSDENRFTFTARLGTEPKFFYTEGVSPIGKLFALLNESYTDKAGVKHDTTLPLNVVVLKPEAVEFAREHLHTGDAISGQGKLSKRTFEKDGKEQSAWEIVIAGPRSKLELLEKKTKKAAAEPSA